MAKKDAPTERIDKRKIPKMFRAVEKGKDPTRWFGVLVSDDGFNFICFAAHDGDASHFKERCLRKSEFNFELISKEDFSLHARKGIHNMKKEMFDKRLDFEAAEHKAEYAETKFQELGAP